MKQCFWLSLIVITCACASARSSGSFIEHPAPPAMLELAHDAARQLAELYPPAHTELSFAHPVDDAFGQPFVTALRGAGFAVAEARTRGTQLELMYVVDEIEPLYRVVLRIRSARRRISMARAYTHQSNAVLAAGAWTQQEGP
jgi:hypothetical protein